jgi:hypothetical protein
MAAADIATAVYWMHVVSVEFAIDVVIDVDVMMSLFDGCC